MDLAALGQLSAEQIRQLVPRFLADYIEDPAASTKANAQVSALFEGMADPNLLGMIEALRVCGEDKRVYPADACCRAVLRSWSESVVVSHTLQGSEHLVGALAKGPTILVGNHLSYFDTAALDVALTWNGHGDIADRLLAAAGPKVYATMFRRFAAASLNTLPVPQSTTFGHTTSLSLRELATQALEAVSTAHAAIGEGYILLIYAEGSRSRSARLQPFLRAVHRYLNVDGAQIVPVSVVGTENISIVGLDQLRSGHLDVRFGPPLALADIGDSRSVLDASYAGLVDILPPAYHPES